MTKAELLELLRSMAGDSPDPEESHMQADDALIEFINDPEIAAAYNEITKWYA